MAHMQMSWPYPLRSKYNPTTPQNLIDYSMTSPLNADGSNFPCKGYQSDTPLDDVATYTAGSTYNMTLAGSATHGGGSCQLSLSYDNGQTFKVIKSMMGGCPLTTEYDFTIPSYAPSGQALFAWTWSNFEGNREFYMNCAAVQIVSSSMRSRRDASFDNLPNIWVANLDSINSCTTDGTDGSLNAVYPDPGPDVVYGAGLSSSSPPTPGDCEVPAQKRVAADLQPSFVYSPSPSATADSTLASSPSTSNSANSTPTSSLITSATTQIFTSIPSSATVLATTATSNLTYTMWSSASTTYLTVSCGPPTITVTLPPSYPPTYTTAAPTCTGTAALCPCASGYACMLVAPCEWACEAQFLPSRFSTLPSPTITSSSPPLSETCGSLCGGTTTNPPTTSPTLAFANRNNLQAYLPCKPGTFICTDSQTFFTCDQDPNGDGGWQYQYPRLAAAGMQCLPQLDHADASFSQQQGNTPASYYRDDQYVRAS